MSKVPYGNGTSCESWRMETVASAGEVAIRIGDAERDRCLSVLNEHHVHGRLSLEELDRRQQLALSAVTADDLASLVEDLPPTSSGRTGGFADTWRSLSLDVRAGRLARWAAAPASLIAGGVVVASAASYSDEQNFAVGFLAAGLGYTAHLVTSRFSRRRR